MVNQTVYVNPYQDDDAVTDEDFTAFYYPCKIGDIDQVILQLEHGADINKRDFFGDTPILHACREGHIDVVRLLIEKGAYFDTDCILFASWGGHIEIIKLFLEQGVIPNNRALESASEHGHIELVKLLLAEGACYNESIRLASRKGHVEIVQLLLRAGGNPNAIVEEEEKIDPFNWDWG